MKQDDLKYKERILKAVANHRRLAIIKFLKIDEATVGDIASNIKLSFKSTSRHLQVLYASDIVEKEQKNTQIFYRLSDKQSIILNSLLANM